MPAGDIERMNYYQEQILGADDFEAQQRYHRDMRRRHGLAHHTWGIVAGLRLFEVPREGDPSVVDVYVGPGMAVDGYGREIVVLEPFKLDPADFITFSSKLVDVWIGFDERRARRSELQSTCETDGMYSRVVETFRIVAQPGASTNDGAVVAGQKILPPPPPPASAEDMITPLDDSVPHQEFADDGVLPRWLVPLGGVRWDRPRRAFVPAGGALREMRRYVGSVASEVLAPDGRIRMRDRADAPASEADETDDLVGIQGALRVDDLLTARNGIQMNDAKIDFRDDAGGNAPPYELFRKDGEGMRFLLGDRNDRTSRFSIGVKEPFEPTFVAWDDGSVDVKGRLDVAGTARVNERLEIRNEQSTTDGDILWIARANRAPGRNDMQLIIGNDLDGSDRLVVGPRVAPDDVREQFVVTNQGDARLTGDMSVEGNIRAFGALDFRQGAAASGDPMVISRRQRSASQSDLQVAIGDTGDGTDRLVVGPRAAGGVVQERFVVESDGDVRVAGDLRFDGRLLAGTTQIPVDVAVGRAVIPASAATNDVARFTVTSRLARASAVVAMAALSDIRADAFTVGAQRWRLGEVGNARLSDNAFELTVNWETLNADLIAFSWVAVFLP